MDYDAEYDIQLTAFVYDSENNSRKKKAGLYLAINEPIKNKYKPLCVDIGATQVIIPTHKLVKLLKKNGII